MSEPQDHAVDEEMPDTLRSLPSPREARAQLDALVATLGADEVCVLTRIAGRLQAGARTYGPLCVATDARAFRGKEAREELEDALVYLACAWLRQELREGRG